LLKQQFGFCCDESIISSAAKVLFLQVLETINVQLAMG